MRLRLTVQGPPVPLQRARSARGRKRSRLYRDLVQAAWMQAGRPNLGSSSLTCSLRFYGARGGADLDNLVKGVLDALSGLAFEKGDGPYGTLRDLTGRRQRRAKRGLGASPTAPFDRMRRGA
jgi:hypothetical protein